MKRFKKVHNQHSAKFNAELNSVLTVKSQPVRYHDQRFTVGKYKGMRVTEVPPFYIQYVLDNWDNLTDRTIRLLNIGLAENKCSN